jgi:antitoxin (DNA-binding transcriptional repressor) of toxin-antitoxin stability system
MERRTITLGDLRRRGPGYFLTRVALRGESYDITRDGRPVAALVPLDRLRALEAAARELARQGDATGD